MTKTLVGLLASATLSLAAISPALAQSSDVAIVKVPFRFIVGDKVLPAGRYRISPQSDDWSVMIVTSVDDASAGAFTATVATPNPAPQSQQPRAWFDNYYGQYFLREVAVPGRDARLVKLTRAQAERTLTRLNLMPAERGEPAK